MESFAGEGDFASWAEAGTLYNTMMLNTVLLTMNANLNQSIISRIQIGKTLQPTAVFLLGANGAGKSSLRSYLDLANIQTNIDPDALNQIARHNNKGIVFASKQAIQFYQHALANHLNVCMESTLSGQSAKRRIFAAKRQGYYVIAYFVGLSNVQLNIARVKQRVQAGGHDIATDLIIKRYQEAVNNLLDCYQHIDELHVIDNSLSHYALQFSSYQARCVTYDEMQAWCQPIYQRLTA